MRFFALGALTLASFSWAQNSTYCTSDSVCYAVNIPDATASSGSGDIFFQISGPSTLSWIGLGQGSSMSGANIFMIYSNAAGTNVTLSPRRGIGERQPSSPSTAAVTLLDGSGISNGMMVANVKCSNCNTWSGGSMSFTDASSDWIWSYRTGAPIASDNTAVNLVQHSKYGTTTLNLQAAAGGNSVNPFAAVVASPASPSSPTGGSTGGAQGTETSDGPSNLNTVILAHAVLMPLAFALFYPLGAMMIRLLNFKNLVWVHAGWMVFTYLIVLAGMGLGVWIAVTTAQLGTYHAIIGLVVTGSLLLQPVTGLTHHLLYKRHSGTNAATYPHVWWGRAIITLGIINGGFGLQLTGEPNGVYIGYGVGAGIVWLLWMSVILMAFLKARGRGAGETGSKVFGSETEKSNYSHNGMRRSGSNPGLHSSTDSMNPARTEREI